MRRTTRFPLIPDDELVIGENPQMNLYEESDLISNIKGPYQEKEYWQTEVPSRPQAAEPALQDTPEDLFPPLYQAEPSLYSRRERLHKPVKPLVVEPKLSAEKTQGQLAREQAREDLKKKRSASYLKDEMPAPAKINKQEPTAPLVARKHTQLSQLADRLRQTEYIVADLPAVYPLGKDERQQETVVKKNSYDFLKKSQVYNYPERKNAQAKSMAQELNLTYMEED